ncbi:MAG: BlaI/MecI/CopY family transcriptional regulator [Acidobacteria bacterium]|nr:BlaI/MecI/CopY family transcriptional regulator [Acidobacteriota bacterium]
MEFSNAEWRLMAEVWRHESVTVTEVHAAVGAESGWAYSTVKTMLARLAEKGALAVTKQGKQSVFRPLVSQSNARRQATASLVDRVFEGAVGGLFQHLLGEHRLSKRDREKLRALLDAGEKRPR